jgi:teichuronic acid biosynthesis glycosyltransferase TuaG
MIAIITPLYKSSNFAAKYANNLANQTFKNFDVFFYDDCSNDNTLQMFTNSLDSVGINYFFHSGKQNCGAGFARDRLIEIIIKDPKYEYISFLDSDDLWEIEKLQLQLDYMLKNESNFVATRTNRKSKYQLGQLIEITKKSLFVEREVCISSVMCSVEIFKKTTNQNTEFFVYRRAEDYNCWISLFDYFINPVIMAEELTLYTFHDNQISYNKLKQAWFVWKLYLKISRNPIIGVYLFVCYAINKLRI